MSDSSIVIAETSVVELSERESGFGTGALVTVMVEGRPFAGWLIIERPDIDSTDDRYCAVVSADPVSVIAAGPSSEVRIQSWSPARDGAPEWARALAAAQWQATRALRAAAASQTALARHQDKLESIVDAAHVYADDNNLCSVFDDFMQRNGLRPRSRDYDITVDVTLRVAVQQSGYDADSANDDVTSAQLADAIYNLSRSEVTGAIRETDIVETEEVG